MKTSQSYGTPNIGCYFDGCAGQEHNDLRVLKLAVSAGWQDGDALRFIEAEGEELGAVRSGEDAEMLAEVCESATEYLNSLETRSFLYWGYEDGNFGLWANVEGAKEDCGFVSSRRQEYPPEGEDFTGEWLHINDHGNCTLYVREAREGSGYFDREIWSVV